MKISVLLVAGLVAFSAAGHTQDCHNGRDIAIGGITGFTDLANFENTQKLRSSCRVSLYLHPYAWQTAPRDKQRAILALFKGTGNPVIEIGMHPNPEAFFKNDFATHFVDMGVTSTEAHVDGFNIDHPLSEWKTFVDAGREAGLSMIAPVFSPNRGQFNKAMFASPVWDNIRSAAAYGGGLTLDPPSDFFFSQAPGYRRFAIDEIRWANSRHLHSAVILSPGNSGSTFLATTKQLVQMLEAQHAVPNEYIIENYAPNRPPSYVNRVGSEQDDNSIAGVALWLVAHVGTTPK